MFRYRCHELPIAPASAISHGIDVQRVFAGILLVSSEGRILLQLREDKPGIANPGGLTTFGGTSEDGEFEYETALRELGEELGLQAAPEDLHHLCDVQKAEADRSRTRCSIWLLECVDPAGLILREGKDIVEGTLDSLKADSRLTPTAKVVLAHYAAYQRYTRADRSGTSIRMLGHAETAVNSVSTDLVNSNRNGFWLLDGAPAIDHNPCPGPLTDTRWLLETADREFAARQAIDCSLPRLVERVSARIRTDLSSNPNRFSHSPSAGLGLGCLSGGVLEYSALADVVIAVQLDDHVWLLDDQVSARHTQYAVALERSQRDHSVRASMQYRQPVKMNSRDGYWALADEPEAARHLRHGYIEVPRGSRLLVASHGFARLMSIFSEHSWPDVLARGPEAAQSMMRHLRDREARDGDRRRFPRASLQGDATVAWLEAI